MKQTAALYQLQTLDSQLDAARKRLAEIDRLLGEDQAVRRAQARLERAVAHLRTWRTRLADLELERQQLREEADSVEQQLYSGKVHNPRELSDMQGKTAELRRRHAEMEEPIIEAMLEIEAGEADVEQAQARHDAALAAQADSHGSLAEERSRLVEQIAGLEAQIEPARAAVEPRHLAIYDRLRQRPGGLAVAALTGSAECSACGMQVTSSMRQQVQHGKVLTCPTCTRLLYLS